MGAVGPFKSPSPPLISFSGYFKFNNNAHNRYITKIILYLFFVQSSTRHFYVTIIIALNSGRVKSILTFRLVVRLPACVFYCITSSILLLNFIIILLIAIVDICMQFNSRIIRSHLQIKFFY